MRCSKGGGGEDLQVSTPCIKASYRGVDHEFTNNCQGDNFDSSSRSQSNFAIEITLYFASCGYKSKP